MQVAWRRIIDEINASSERYLLCVSGGVDSMFMLDFFSRQCQRPFRVGHFNHALRASADIEERMVREWCAERGVDFLVGSGDPEAMKSASSLEAEARRQRYGFFEANGMPGEMLVTAHHANDQLETVILRLMRGYPDGELRMLKFRDNRYKPFLSVPKEEILRQAMNRKLVWMEDESNGDLRIERNWVRNVLVPQMMERRNVLRTIALRDLLGGDATRKEAAHGNAEDAPDPGNGLADESARPKL